MTEENGAKSPLARKKGLAASSRVIIIYRVGLRGFYVECVPVPPLCSCCSSRLAQGVKDSEKQDWKMMLLKPWKRKVAAKIQPSVPSTKVLEKQASDSDDTTPLWESESTLRDSLSSIRSIDSEVRDQVKTATDTKQQRKKSVSFDTVETREYGLIVGDSEDIIDGFPLMLDWKHTEGVKETVDVHQDHAKARDRCGPIQELDSHERRLRLRAMGFTEAQLRLAERRRRVLISQEWAYGQNKKNTPPFLNKSFVNNYVK